MDEVQNSGEKFVNLSRATILAQSRTPQQTEDTLDLMMGTDRYVKEDKCEELGIVPEPAAEVKLDDESISEILESYSGAANRFDLDAYLPDEEEEEEDDN